MNRTALTLAALLAMLVGPALAAPLPPVKATDCSGLVQARAQARAAAAPLAYDVVDLDGDNAHAFERDQAVQTKDQVEHLTVMVNPKTGRAVALLADGPNCAFQSVLMVMAPSYAKPIDAALDALRLAR